MNSVDTKRALLRGGAVHPLDEIQARAKDEGIRSWRAIEAAKANLGVESLREDKFQGRVLGWRLGSDL